VVPRSPAERVHSAQSALLEVLDQNGMIRTLRQPKSNATLGRVVEAAIWCGGSEVAVTAKDTGAAMAGRSHVRADSSRVLLSTPKSLEMQL
jgi:hypothetical protein